MDDYKKFLRKKKNLSERTIQDYASRCRRIEKEFLISIDDETRSANLYINLVNRIRDTYYLKKKFGVTNKYAMSQLTGALKLYVEFRRGKNFIKSSIVSRAVKISAYS